MNYFKSINILVLLSGFFFTVEAFSTQPDENVPPLVKETSKTPPAKPQPSTSEKLKEKAAKAAKKEDARFRDGAYQIQRLQKKRRMRHK